MNLPLRPRYLIGVAGVGTEIGKTFVSVQLLTELSGRGWFVNARKPAQSVAPGETTDSELLGQASGEDPALVCSPSRTYLVPMAPPMAATQLGFDPPQLGELIEEVSRSWGGRVADIGLVETAGGVASPLGIDGDNAQFLGSLEPELILLVADAGLGTINSIRLSVGHLQVAAPGVPIVVWLNHFDHANELHILNREWLQRVDGLRCLTTVDECAALVEASIELICGHCGLGLGLHLQPCETQLDPKRYCERCGRKLNVTISPNDVSARCKVHGMVAWQS